MLWNAVRDHGIGHRFDDAHAVNPPCNTDRQAFPRELVDQRHQPDFLAVVALSFNKVVRPDVIASPAPAVAGYSCRQPAKIVLVAFVSQAPSIPHRVRCAERNQHRQSSRSAPTSRRLSPMNGLSTDARNNLAGSTLLIPACQCVPTLGVIITTGKFRG